MAKEKTKLCKHCKSEIPSGAKVCPNCRKKQGGTLKWVVVGVIAIGVIAAAVGGGENDKKKSTTSNAESQKQEEISYTPCTVNDMVSILNENAAKASKEYKDQYLEVTGKLSNIDSDLAYITLAPDDEFAIIGIQCVINGEDQENAVVEMKVGDTVTLKGKCTEVGEVLGYTIEIDSIS